MDSNFFKWREHTGTNLEKFYKTTFWQGEHLMIGMNCLEAGQVQKTHAHLGADKFYFVLQGRGHFVIGDEEREAEAGELVVARAGVEHGVSNKSNSRVSLLVAIAPSR